MIDLSQIHAIAAELRAEMADDFDEQAFLDTLDGATDALDIIDWMIRKTLDDEALADAIRAQITDMASRRDRVDARAVAMRGRVLALMDAIGEAKIERPRATISRTAGRVSVDITDASAVPTQLCVTKTTVTPDKAAIKKQIEAGETVPGAALVRGPDSLSMRVK